MVTRIPTDKPSTAPLITEKPSMSGMVIYFDAVRKVTEALPDELRDEMKNEIINFAIYLLCWNISCLSQIN